MRKFFLLFTIALCVMLVVSCKNNKRAETIKAAKAVLTIDVLSTLDQLAEQYWSAIDSLQTNIIGANLNEMSEEEKLVKPTYLLDAKYVANLVTKEQKTNALAILLSEYPLRVVYELPVTEVDSAIAKLLMELDIPNDIYKDEKAPLSEKVKNIYNWCKEHNEIEYFWKFNFAILKSVHYIYAMDTDLFLGNLSEEQLSKFWDRSHAIWKAAFTLADYDKEINMVVNSYKEIDPEVEEWVKTRKSSFGETLEDSKRFFSTKKAFIAAQRTAMLK